MTTTVEVFRRHDMRASGGLIPAQVLQDGLTTAEQDWCPGAEQTIAVPAGCGQWQSGEILTPSGHHLHALILIAPQFGQVMDAKVLVPPVLNPHGPADPSWTVQMAMLEPGATRIARWFTSLDSRFVLHPYAARSYNRASAPIYGGTRPGRWSHSPRELFGEVCEQADRADASPALPVAVEWMAAQLPKVRELHAVR